jgi:hypothetical protein
MKCKILFLVAVLFWSVFCSTAYSYEAPSLTGVGSVSETTRAPLDVFQSGGQTIQHQHSLNSASINAVLDPWQKHAAEVLAYLLKITLGIAGDPKYRHQWRTRGLDEPLNFRNVVKTMTETNRNALDLMVLDPNILDLTTVLYHYDKRLSLYEGNYGVTSIYPASEFIAIRLFLLKKIHSGEKVSLSALVAREDLLRNPAARPTEQDLRAMNVTAGEIEFLQAIIQGKPHLFQYLKSPFMVQALYSAGAVFEDDFVKEMIAEASFRAYPCRHLQGSRERHAVRLFFLPSMTDEFVHGQPGDHGSSNDFQPTGFFLEMISDLTRQIEKAAKTCMEKEFVSGESVHVPMGNARCDAVWPQIEKKYLSFYVADQRPFVIYPENAAKAIREICPQADFTVILLGKNVYKSIFFDRKADSYPAVNRIYVDIMDIKHARTEEDAQAIGCFVAKRMAERILAERTSPGKAKQELHNTSVDRRMP